MIQSTKFRLPFGISSSNKKMLVSEAFTWNLEKILMIVMASHLYMVTPSTANIFRVTGLCGGILRSPVNSPHQRQVTRSFDVSFHLRLNKRLSKQSRCADYDVIVMRWFLLRAPLTMYGDNQAWIGTVAIIAFRKPRWSWRQLSRHLWHRALSLWQSTVPPMTRKLAPSRLTFLVTVMQNISFWNLCLKA